jgi:hypothetical protein
MDYKALALPSFHIGKDKKFLSFEVNANFPYVIRYRGACPLERLQPIDYLRPLKWDCSKDGHVPLACDLTEKASLIETLVGGKGLSLALLKSLDDPRVNLFPFAVLGISYIKCKTFKFQVPGGFCITTEAFARQIQTFPLLDTAINVLKEVAYSEKNLELKSVCEM